MKQTHVFSLLSLCLAALVLLAALPRDWVLGGNNAGSNSSLRRQPSAALDPLWATPLAIRGAAGRKRKRAAIYARFSTRYQTSTDDQIRACREWCEANDIEVDESLIFKDEAISAKKNRRPGLTQLKQKLTAKAFDVLVTFATSRLHRSGYKGRQFIQEEVVERGVRCVCIRSGVDTADEQWGTLHGVHAMVDDIMLKTTADGVRNANAGGFLQGFVIGRLPFGYTGKPIEGLLTKLKRPKSKVIVDPVSSVWVKQIFEWYVNEDLSIIAIATRLVAEGASRPAGVKIWKEAVVRKLLTNPRYVGNWAYGVTKTRWLHKRDYGLQEKQEKPLQEVHREDLRIIDDVAFLAVQAKLGGRNHSAGRKTGEGIRNHRILNGLLWCPIHDRPLRRSGRFICPECRRGREAGRLYSELPAELALRTLCSKLVELLRGDQDLVTKVIDAFQQLVEGQQRPDLSRVPELEGKKERLTRAINSLSLNMGETDEDIAEAEKNLRDLRGQRAAADAEIAKLNQLATKEIRVPTAMEVQAVIGNLTDVFASAAMSITPNEPQMLRKIIDAFTGGKIVCSQAGEATFHRGWIRGSFEVSLVRVIGQGLNGDINGHGVPVDVDFVDATQVELLADEAKRLYDQQIPIKKVARLLNKPCNLVRQALDHWFASRGLTREDGRTRRSSIPEKHLEKPLYQRIADDVKRLGDEGLLFQQIARQLDVDRNTVTQAWKYWHTVHDVTPITGHKRREVMNIKNETPRRRRSDEEHRPAA